MRWRRATGGFEHGACAGHGDPANNGEVLVAGGIDNTGTPLSSTEIYNPATNSFSAGPAMNAARAGATATLLNDGRVLIAGEFAAGFVPNSTEIFDGTNSFASGPTMSSTRLNPTATLLPNGDVLIAGGELEPNASASADLYDGTNNCFAGESSTPCSGRPRQP